MAITENLLAAGWAVSVGSRGQQDQPAQHADRRVRYVAVDRGKPGDLARALGDGADTLIDVTGYDAGTAASS